MSSAERTKGKWPSDLSLGLRSGSSGRLNVTEPRAVASGIKTQAPKKPDALSWRTFPGFRNRPAFFQIINHQDQLVLMVTVNDLDVYAGFGHHARDFP